MTMRSRHQVDMSVRFRADAATAEPYLADQDLEDAVNLAIALGRPLLLQGDPGYRQDAASARGRLRARPAVGGGVHQVDQPRPGPALHLRRHPPPLRRAGLRPDGCRGE